MYEIAGALEPRRPPQPFSEREIVSLIVNSFKLSRGMGEAQSQIIRFIAVNYYAHIDSPVVLAAAPQIAEIAGRIHADKRLHPRPLSKEIEKKVFGDEIFRAGDVKEQVDQYCGELITQDTPFDMTELFDALVIADRNWITGISKRTNDYRTPLPYRSHLVEHALLGRTTGIAEFNEMFKQVETFWQKFRTQFRSKTDVDYELEEIIKTHINVNPEDAKQIYERLS